MPWYNIPRGFFQIFETDLDVARRKVTLSHLSDSWSISINELHMFNLSCLNHPCLQNLNFQHQSLFQFSELLCIFWIIMLIHCAEQSLLLRMFLDIFDMMNITTNIYVLNFYDLSAWDGSWSLVSVLMFNYKFLNVCPFDCTPVAGSGMAEPLNLR